MRDYSIQSLQRAMQILDVLLECGAPLRLEDIAAKTGLVKSTAYRIIDNLLKRGYLSETDEGYWLGLKMLRFGAMVEAKLELKQQALPFLRQLRDETNETVHLAVLDDDWRVVYLEKLSAQQSIGIMMSRVGITTPMYCTGLGKAMVAYRDEDKIRQWIRKNKLKRHTDTTITDEAKFLKELRETRARGYSVDNGEHEEHVHCIAAPIRERNGTVIAAVSIAGPDSRIPVPLIGCPMAMRVVEAARCISESLGYTESSSAHSVNPSRT